MNSSDFALDDFIDDCFINDDPLCKKDEKEYLELVASKLIASTINYNPIIEEKLWIG